MNFPLRKRRVGDRRRSSLRRGWVSLWLLVWLPVLLVLLSALLGIANLWLARVELENALEAAALAAAKQWGDQEEGQTETASEVGRMFAAANSIRGESVNLDKWGEMVFGAIDEEDCIVFRAGVDPFAPSEESEAYSPGVRVSAVVPVRSFGTPLLGRIEGYRVQAKATARYDRQSGRVRLVRIDKYVGS